MSKSELLLFNLTCWKKTQYKLRIGYVLVEEGTSMVLKRSVFISWRGTDLKYPYNAFRVNQKIQTLRWRLNLHSGYVPHVSKIHVLNILRAFLSDTATTIWFSLIRKMKIFLYFDVNMYSFGFFCRTCLNIGAPWIHLILALQNRQRCNYV